MNRLGGQARGEDLVKALERVVIPLQPRDHLLPFACVAQHERPACLGEACESHCDDVAAALAREFQDTPVILDHLARAGQGTPAQYDEVLRMSKLPRVDMKFSGVGYSSKQGYPFRDVKPLVRRTYDAFGPDRMIWGGLGMNLADFEKNVAMFDEMFDFASEADRAKKLAFYTVDMLTDLLDVGTITTADRDVTVTISEGHASELYRHLFKRPDGSQVLFIYDKSASPTVRATLRTRGTTALRYEVDGSSAKHAAFDGHTLTDIRLTAGHVAIFRIDP